MESQKQTQENTNNINDQEERAGDAICGDGQEGAVTGDAEGELEEAKGLAAEETSDVEACVAKGKKKVASKSCVTINVCNAQGFLMTLLKELVKDNNWRMVENRATTKGVDVYWLHTLDAPYWDPAKVLMTE